MPIGDGRVRQPPLTAATAKVVNRAPLTPKVATKGPQVVTPLGRRMQNQVAIVANAQTYDVATPPTAAYLAGNITPRSGKRQSRVESANSTPNGTPVPDNVVADGRENGRGLWGLSSVAYDAPAPTSPGEASSETSESKFFYASDAKTLPQAQPQRPVSVPQKPTAFVYANATPSDDKRRTSPSSNSSFTPVLGAMPEPVTASKFFYANGTPDGPPKQGLPISSPASAVSSVSRVLPARTGTGSPATGHASTVSSRPASPLKATSPPMAGCLKSSAMPAFPTTRSPVASPPPMAPLSHVDAKRRVSIEATPRPNKKLTRVESFKTEPVLSSRLAPSLESPFDLSPTSSSPGFSHPTLTMASILQAVEDLGGEQGPSYADTQSDVQSPTKSAQSPDAVSELVANARRERKVQDLEITNASLEAINRTLERQMRKQTTEIRRYRRLSRSGRLSLASVASSRATSATLTNGLGGLPGVSEDEETDEDDEPDSLDGSETSSADSFAADPLSSGAKVTARRQRDERRLQLDLSKHQELLVDSQKMNQSLKRCLDWTEVLIKEGQKALAYHVRVSDVALGGRVLAPPDEDDVVEDENEDHHTVLHLDCPSIGNAQSVQLDGTKEPPD